MAPQISKKPLHRDDDEPGSQDTIFAQLEAQTFGRDEPGEETQTDPKYAELERRIEEMRNQLEETNRTNMALLTQAPRSQVADVQPQNVQEKPLPDPALDPDAYATAVEDRLTRRLEARQQNSNSQKQREADLKQKVDGLWEDFGDLYPDYDQERVEFAAGKVAEKAKRKGIDVEKYMFVTSERFIKDTAKEYERLFGVPEEDDDDSSLPKRTRKAKPARDGQTRNRRVRDDNDDDDGRSASIFGGQESGGRPGARSEDNTTNMIDDIQALQRKTGFF